MPPCRVQAQFTPDLGVAHGVEGAPVLGKVTQGGEAGRSEASG